MSTEIHGPWITDPWVPADPNDPSVRAHLAPRYTEQVDLSAGGVYDLIEGRFLDDDEALDDDLAAIDKAVVDILAEDEPTASDVVDAAWSMRSRLDPDTRQAALKAIRRETLASAEGCDRAIELSSQTPHQKGTTMGSFHLTRDGQRVYDQEPAYSPPIRTESAITDFTDGNPTDDSPYTVAEYESPAQARERAEFLAQAIADNPHHRKGGASLRANNGQRDWPEPAVDPTPRPTRMTYHDGSPIHDTHGNVLYSGTGHDSGPEVSWSDANPNVAAEDFVRAFRKQLGGPGA